MNHPPAQPRSVTPVPPRDPVRHVLDSIGAAQGVAQRNQPADVRPSGEKGPKYPKLMDHPDIPAKPIKPSANPPSSQDEDLLRSSMESARQIQQLAQRLADQQRRLYQQQLQLDQQQVEFAQSSSRSEAQLERRNQQVQQQAAQVRIQQRHVMQLQDDIVGSYEAIKVAIENLMVDSTLDRHSAQQLHAIKHQLGPRFDYIARRWEHLYGLLQNQRVQLDAALSVDDEVNWSA